MTERIHINKVCSWETCRGRTMLLEEHKWISGQRSLEGLSVSLICNQFLDSINRRLPFFSNFYPFFFQYTHHHSLRDMPFQWQSKKSWTPPFFYYLVWQEDLRRFQTMQFPFLNWYRECSLATSVSFNIAFLKRKEVLRQKSREVLRQKMLSQKPLLFQFWIERISKIKKALFEHHINSTLSLLQQPQAF